MASGLATRRNENLECAIRFRDPAVKATYGGAEVDVGDSAVVVRVDTPAISTSTGRTNWW